MKQDLRLQHVSHAAQLGNIYVCKNVSFSLHIHLQKIQSLYPSVTQEIRFKNNVKQRLV